MRELARNQRLRSAVAIAEGKAEDAITILGQQLAMAITWVMTSFWFPIWSARRWLESHLTMHCLSSKCLLLPICIGPSLRSQIPHRYAYRTRL